MTDIGILFSVPIWLMFAATILLYVGYIAPHRVWINLQIKGPQPLPIFGNALEFYDEKVGVRSAVNKWKAKYGKIIGAYFFRSPMLVVLDVDLIKHVFIKDFQVFGNRWFVGNGNLEQPIIKQALFFADVMNWKRIRHIVSPTFSSSKMKLVMHHINKTASNLGTCLIKYAAEEKPANAKTVFGSFALDIICGTAFGLDVNSQKDYDSPLMKHVEGLMTIDKSIKLAILIVGIFSPMSIVIGKLGIGFLKSHEVKYWETLISDLITERKANGELQKHVDYLQLMMNAEDDSEHKGVGGTKKLSTEEIIAQGIMFLIAGYETTSSTMQFISYEISRRPDVQEQIMSEIVEVIGWDGDPTFEQCQHLEYMDAVINETLRCYPVIHLLTRTNETEFKARGITLPANTCIMIPIANIMRDPDYFPEPDLFRPERFLEDEKQCSHASFFMPFGLGPRRCIGMRLVMVELKVALVHLLRKVQLLGTTPELLELDDYTGLLTPKIPIELYVKPREKPGTY